MNRLSSSATLKASRSTPTVSSVKVLAGLSAPSNQMTLLVNQLWPHAGEVSANRGETSEDWLEKKIVVHFLGIASEKRKTGCGRLKLWKS